MQPWKVRARETILNHSKFLTVENHTVELPDGQIIPDWPWIITPDFVNIAAVTEDEKILCFRQIKYSVGAISLAPIGGYLEPGEDPLAAAKRELLEETGYEAPDWLDLGHYWVDGNRGAGLAYFFLACGARPVAEINTDDLEEQELLTLSRADIEAALLEGAFKVLPWATIMALALQHWK